MKNLKENTAQIKTMSDKELAKAFISMSKKSYTLWIRNPQYIDILVEEAQNRKDTKDPDLALIIDRFPWFLCSK